MHSSIDKCHCYDTVCEQNCIHFVFLNFNLLPEINMIKAHLHVSTALDHVIIII